MTFDTSTLWMNPGLLSALSWWSIALAIVALIICICTFVIAWEDGEFTREMVRMVAIFGLGAVAFGSFFFVGLNGAGQDRAEARATLGAAIQDRYGIELADPIVGRLAQDHGQNWLAEGGEPMMREMAGTVDIVLEGEDVTLGLAWAGDQWRLVAGNEVKSPEYPLADSSDEDES